MACVYYDTPATVVILTMSVYCRRLRKVLIMMNGGPAIYATIRSICEVFLSFATKKKQQGDYRVTDDDTVLLSRPLLDEVPDSSVG